MIKNTLSQGKMLAAATKNIAAVNVSFIRKNKAHIKYTSIVKSAKKQTHQAFVNFL